MSTRRLSAFACALVIGGCGGGPDAGRKQPPARTGASATRVTLNLKGGGSEQATACGVRHHYTTYSRGGQISLGGAVRPVPAGRWKVKVKLKVCTGGSFKDLSKIEATRDKHTGLYSASVGVTKPGRYVARASLYVAGHRAARSDKQQFAVK